MDFLGTSPKVFLTVWISFDWQKMGPPCWQTTFFSGEWARKELGMGHEHLRVLFCVRCSIASPLVGVVFVWPQVGERGAEASVAAWREQGRVGRQDGSGPGGARDR